MKPRFFPDEQIIQMLKEQAAVERAADVCRRYGISQGAFYKY
jgi:putative transposase